MHLEVLVVELVDVQAARLAAPVRARLSEAGRDRDGHALLAAGRDLELAPFSDRALVDVTRDDQLRAGVDERSEYVVAARDRLLSRAPRRADQVVVEDGDPQGLAVAVAEHARRALELRRAQAAGLV